MSENRDIEQRLRDYGKKRRDESGTSRELHPATRRLLQGEVARAYASAKSTSARSSRRWQSNWARLGLAVSLFVGLGAATVVLLKVESPAEKSVQLARSPDDMLSSPTDQPASELRLAQHDSPAIGGLEREILGQRAAAPAAPTAPTPRYSRDSKVALNDAATNNERRTTGEPKIAVLKDMADDALLLSESKRKVEAQTDPRQRIPGPTAVQSSRAAAPQSVPQLQLAAEKAVSPATAPLTLGESAVMQNQPAAVAPLASPTLQVPALSRQRSYAVATSNIPITTTTTSVFYSDPTRTETPAQNPNGTVLGAAVADAGALSATWEEGGKFDGQFKNISVSTARLPGTAGQDKDNLSRRAGTGPTNDVLSGFQFSYADGEVRVTDQDGSVYAGRDLLTSTASDESLPAPSTKPQPSPRGAAEAVRLQAERASMVTRRLSFEVVGTNRTLKQKVNFNGVIAPQSELRETDVSKQSEDAAKKTTDQTARRPAPRTAPPASRAAVPQSRREAPSTSSMAVAIGGARVDLPKDRAKESASSPMQITGRVKVGNNPELPVDAVPASAPPQ